MAPVMMCSMLTTIFYVQSWIAVEPNDRKLFSFAFLPRHPHTSPAPQKLEYNPSILTLAAFGFQEMSEHYHHTEGSMELPELNGIQ